MKKTTTKPSPRAAALEKKPNAPSEMMTVLQGCRIPGVQSRNDLPAAEEPPHPRLQAGRELAFDRAAIRRMDQEDNQIALVMGSDQI